MLALQPETVRSPASVSSTEGYIYETAVIFRQGIHETEINVRHAQEYRRECAGFRHPHGSASIALQSRPPFEARVRLIFLNVPVWEWTLVRVEVRFRRCALVATVAQRSQDFRRSDDRTVRTETKTLGPELRSLYLIGQPLGARGLGRAIWFCFTMELKWP